MFCNYEISPFICYFLQFAVPFLITASEDLAWGVRKSSCEVFVDIANNCTMETKERKLAPRFITLLHDTSRWVIFLFPFFFLIYKFCFIFHCFLHIDDCSPIYRFGQNWTHHSFRRSKPCNCLEKNLYYCLFVNSWSSEVMAVPTIN